MEESRSFHAILAFTSIRFLFVSVAVNRLWPRFSFCLSSSGCNTPLLATIKATRRDRRRWASPTASKELSLKTSTENECVVRECILLVTSCIFPPSRATYLLTANIWQSCDGGHYQNVIFVWRLQWQYPYFVAVSCPGSVGLETPTKGSSRAPQVGCSNILWPWPIFISSVTIEKKNLSFSQ